MSIGIEVAEGQQIPLQVQESAKDGTKVVRATLYNVSNGAVIASNVLLAHVGDGFYRNYSVTMPDVAFVQAQYQVFDADGLTPNSTGDQAVSDLFKRLEGASGGGGSTQRDDTLVAVISNEDEKLVAKIADDDNPLVAKISNDDDTFVAVLQDEDETLQATIDDDNSLVAELNE